VNWYKTVVFERYALFNGRAMRTEFWMFQLFNFLISIVLAIVDAILGTDGGGTSPGVIGGLYSLAVLIPSLAVGSRRLHDTNRSGWWQLLYLIPVIGWIVLLIFFVQDSDAGENQHGPNPKAAPAPAM
jgi:uncharacterized membrane protein YhaH (DUF805 family)